MISNSTCHDGGYLDHCAEAITSFLNSLGVTKILFVPYALANQDGYASKIRERLALMGFSVDSIHEFEDKKAAISSAQAVFVGGGNTFRLITKLYSDDILIAIRERVLEGMPYIGTSAGTNVACPTIKTTNDMPIVQPPSFDALSIIPFQINPHYLDAPEESKHMGETREERIREFLEENDVAVVGLREGTLLRVEDQTA